MVRNTNKNTTIQKKEVLRYCYVTLMLNITGQLLITSFQFLPFRYYHYCSCALLLTPQNTQFFVVYFHKPWTKLYILLLLNICKLIKIPFIFICIKITVNMLILAVNAVCELLEYCPVKTRRIDPYLRLNPDPRFPHLINSLKLIYSKLDPENHLHAQSK